MMYIIKEGVICLKCPNVYVINSIGSAKYARSLIAIVLVNFMVKISGITVDLLCAD